MACDAPFVSAAPAADFLVLIPLIPQGEFCDIAFAGTDLGVGYYGLPFNLRVPQENITAYSILANAAISARYHAAIGGIDCLLLASPD